MYYVRLSPPLSSTCLLLGITLSIYSYLIFHGLSRSTYGRVFNSFSFLKMIQVIEVIKHLPHRLSLSAQTFIWSMIVGYD